MTFAHHHYHKNAHPHYKVVDAFRAIGILMVIWYHLWLQSWLTADFTIGSYRVHTDLIPEVGYLGVEILLFITGFGLFLPVAAKMLTKNSAEEEGFSLKSFFGHRFLRIIPSYYIALLAGFFLFTAESTSFSSEPLKHLFTHLTFTHIFFNETSGSISTVFWTLGTEALFYLIFPIIAWLSLRGKGLFWITITLMIVTAYTYRLLVLSNYSGNIEHLLRQMPAFLDIYAMGILTAFFLTWIQKKGLEKEFLEKRIFWTFLSIVFIALFFYLCDTVSSYARAENGRFIFLTYYRIIIGILVGVLVISINFSFAFLRNIFTNKLVIFVSVISYNLYLWHYLILMELKSKNIPAAATVSQIEDPAWRFYYFWIALFASIIVAAFFTFLIERPLIKLLGRIKKNQIIPSSTAPAYNSVRN